MKVNVIFVSWYYIIMIVDVLYDNWCYIFMFVNVLLDCCFSSKYLNFCYCKRLSNYGKVLCVFCVIFIGRIR